MARTRSLELCDELDSTLRGAGIPLPERMPAWGIYPPNPAWVSNFLPTVAANAFQPDVNCIIPYEGAISLGVAPVLPIAQEVCRYLREHPEIMPQVQELVALRIYQHSKSIFKYGEPAIKFERLADKQIIGSANNVLRYIDSNHSILIPGCGLSTLRHIRFFEFGGGKDKLPPILLNDSDPFVAGVAKHLLRYMANPNLTFQEGDLGELTPHAATTIAILSFVDRASNEAIVKLLSKIPKCCVYSITTRVAYNYTGSDTDMLIEPLSAAGFKASDHLFLRGSPTHSYDEQGNEIDFCALTVEQAIQMAYPQKGHKRMALSSWYPSRKDV